MMTRSRPLRPLLPALLILGLSAACTSTSAPLEPGGSEPASTAPATPEQGGGEASALPSPQSLLERYVAAVGGEEAIRAHSSMMARGTFEMPSMGLEGDLVLYSAAPDLLLVRIEVPGVGEILQGFDGEVAWSDNAMTGPTVIEGEAREDVRREADFYAELSYDELCPTLETVEETELEGEAVLKLRCVDTSGKESFHFFSVESGLLVGTEGEQETEMGPVYVTSRIGGYEERGGRLVPTELYQSAMGMEQVMRLTEFQFDAVDPSVFELPKAIQVLVQGE